MRSELLDLVLEHDEIADLDPVDRRLALRSILISAGMEDVGSLTAELADEIDGYGPITELMHHPTATDIFINGYDSIQIEVDGELEDTGCRFRSSEHLLSWCERIVSRAGGRVDTSQPIADARLADGSRIHVVLPPLAPEGPMVSIRRFPHDPYNLDRLVGLGAVSDAQADVLRSCVATGRSILVSGQTGAGKTTLLGALLAEVPSAERAVVIEELPELRRGPSDKIHLVARAANADGVGEVSLAELVRASLRMRPDRIVIGEVRGPEALAALWAMRTGHAGAMLTIHAASAGDARRRLLHLAMAHPDAPAERTLAEEIDAAVEVCVHMTRAGGRKVADISIAE